MSQDIDSIIEGIIRREGGYVNHPNDKGGPTKYGITLSTLEKWRGVECSANDVKRLTKTEARAIYRDEYYLTPGISRLPESIQPVLFDMAVNHGPKNAVKMLQETMNGYGYDCGLVDGLVGGKTIAAARWADTTMDRELVRAIAVRRKSFYRAIVRNDPSQEEFLAGWLNRAEEFMT